MEELNEKALVWVPRTDFQNDKNWSALGDGTRTTESTAQPHCCEPVIRNQNQASSAPIAVPIIATGPRRLRTGHWNIAVKPLILMPLLASRRVWKVYASS